MISEVTRKDIPDSKIHGANMEPNWGRQDPGGPDVGHINLAIWDATTKHNKIWKKIIAWIILGMDFIRW